MYKIIAEHLETFLAEAREQYQGALPLLGRRRVPTHENLIPLVRALRLVHSAITFATGNSQPAAQAQALVQARPAQF